MAGCVFRGHYLANQKSKLEQNDFFGSLVMEDRRFRGDNQLTLCSG